MQEKNNRFSIRASNLDTYTTCPKKYYFSCIRKLHKPYGEKSPNLAFYNVIYNTLNNYYKKHNKNEAFSYNNLYEIFRTFWSDNDYLTPEQAAEYRINAESCLKEYYLNYCEGKSDNHINTDLQFNLNLFGVEYKGRIDRVDRNPDGTVEVIYYKTGKITDNTVSEAEETISHHLLFFVCDHFWPEAVKRITYHYLKDNKVIYVNRDANKLENSRIRLLQIVNKINSGVFPEIRNIGCSYCDYKDSCQTGRIPVISSSKLKTYLECPSKYNHIYVLKNNTKLESNNSISLLLDRPIHDTLADFYNKPELPGNTQESKLFTIFYSKISKQLDEMTQINLKRIGRDYLAKYLKFFYDSSKPLFINENLEFSNLNSCFQATIDRIDEDKDGNYILIDYKTGKNVQNVRQMTDDPSICALCAAADVKFPNKIKIFKCIYLQTGESVEIPVTPFIIDRGHRYIEHVCFGIQRKKFPTLAGFSCYFCPIKTNCSGRKPIVSLTKIQTIKECPKKYQYRYIDRTNVESTKQSNSSLLFYNFITQMLTEYVHQHKIFPTEILMQYATKKLNEQTQLSETERNELENNCNTAFTYFNKIIAARGLPKVKFLKEELRKECDDYVLTAKLDRLDILPNGMMQVVLYKTNKEAPAIEELKKDFTAVYYWYVANLLFPQKIDSVLLIYVLAQKMYRYTPDEQDLERLKLTLYEYLNECKSETHEGLHKSSCINCDYASICEDAQKMTLTPSKINCFESCSLKYKLQYIDKLPKESRPTPNLSFDRSLHYALKELHENFTNEKLASENLKTILDHFWISDGYNDTEEENRFKSRGYFIFEEYYNSLTGNEKPILFSTSACWHYKGIELTVQIDRVDELKDGTYEIIDYKTGKNLPDQRVINEDTALMNLYMAAQEKWPGKVSCVSYYYLATNQKFSLQPTKSDIESHKKRIDSIISNLNTDSYIPNKGSLCAWCEFYGPCPEWKIKPHEVAGESQEQFRQRIRLSYSKMSLYLNCPLAYKKLYIDKIPPKPQPFFSFGTIIHETFERVYDPNVKRQNKPTLQEILDIYEKVRLTHREGFESDQLEEKYRRDGIRQITMYYNQFIKDKPFKQAHAIEEYFEIPCGKYAVMTGFIDRIDKLPDGTYEILDYKTEPTLRTQEAVDADKQLSIYYWAAVDTMKLNVSKLSLLMLDHDKKIITKRQQEEIPNVIQTIDNIAYDMLHETQFLPKKNKYCKSCDHLESCPLRNEILSDSSLISMKKF